MIKSKLIQLLKSLSSAEMKEFGRYLEGTSYRKGGAVFTLFEYLKKQHPEFPDDKIEKELVHKKTRKDKKPLGRNFFDLVSKLNGEVEKFLIQKKIMSKEVDRELILLEVLRERQLHKMFFQKASLLEKNWDKLRDPGSESVYQKYRLIDFLVTHPKFDRFSFDVLSKHKELLDELDKFYVSAKLVNVQSFVSHNRSANKERSFAEIQEDHFLLESIMNYVEKGDSNRPVAKLFAKFIIAQANNEFSNFDEVDTIWKENLDQFSQREKIDAFSVIADYCLQNYFGGKDEFFEELFNQYVFGAEKGFFIEDGIITKILFFNIVNTGVRLGKVDWTRTFVNEYQQYLPKEIREDATLLCEAKLLFLEEAYEEILSSLAMVKFHDPEYGLEARSIQIKCYYELGDKYAESLESMLLSFRAFLRRDNLLIQYMRERGLNFLAFLSKIYSLRCAIQVTEAQIEELKSQINSCTQIMSVAWLCSKLEETKK